MRIHFYVRDMDGNISVHAPGLDEEAVREKMIVAMRQELVETYGEEAAGWDDDKVADEMGVCESAFFYMREIDLSYRPSSSGGGQISPELEPFKAATAVWIRRGEFGRLHDWAGRMMKAHDEVLLFHVLAHDEVTFPFERLTRFEGMEEVKRLVADPVALRTAYLEEVKAFRRRLRRVCLANRIDLVEMDTAESLGVVLSAYLAKRAAVRRR